MRSFSYCFAGLNNLNFLITESIKDVAMMWKNGVMIFVLTMNIAIIMTIMMIAIIMMIMIIMMIRESSQSLGIKKNEGGGMNHTKIFLVDLTQCTECSPEWSLNPNSDHFPPFTHLRQDVASHIYALLSSNPPECHVWGKRGGGGVGSSQSWQCQDFESLWYGNSSHMMMIMMNSILTSLNAWLAFCSPSAAITWSSSS